MRIDSTGLVAIALLVAVLTNALGSRPAPAIPQASTVAATQDQPQSVAQTRAPARSVMEYMARAHPGVAA